MYNVALLSNTNVEPIVNKLSKDNNVYKPSGYGNVFEELLNPSSELKRFSPDAIFIVIDLSELIINCHTDQEIKDEVDSWFHNFDSCINLHTNYFISDADIRERIIGITVSNYSFSHFEAIWNRKLEEAISKYHNVYTFPYKQYVENIGKSNFYSPKLWLLGRVALSEEGRKAIIAGIEYSLHLLGAKTRKVMVLDLDNTLWGGLAGENDKKPIDLSNEHAGLLYKNFQRAIKRIKNTGVLLAIVSKNNQEEALDIIENNPHMILKKEDFVSIKINWKQKDANIAEIAKDLNLGLDSFVFVDDNPAERELIKTSLPMVTVPDFPEKAEQLPEFAVKIYDEFFRKLIFSKEDESKTEQYKANIMRNEMQQELGDFTVYLQNLHIQVNRVDPSEHSERIYQLLNKTNQFNLTTRRYTYAEINELLEDKSTIIYLFEILDKFGNNGITAIVIVRTAPEKDPCIDSFVLSCRIMGKYIEHYILNYVEQDLKEQGYDTLEAAYLKTAKNMPVENFYDELEYELIRKDEMHKTYRIYLNEAHKREFYIDARNQ